MRPIIFTILFGLASFAHASSASERLADGSLVPAGTDFAPPAPVAGRLPSVRPIAGLNGTYEADIVIAENGDILDIKVKHHIHPTIDRQLTKKLRQVQFQPATLNGVPVAAIFRASYEFTSRSLRPGG